jgi:exosortase
VSLFAAYEIRKKYRDESYQPCLWGLPVVILGVGIVVVGLWYRYALLPGGLGVQSVTGLGLFILLVGLCLSFGGPSFITRYLFPICFFAFAVPWPESLTNRITVPLRTIVSDISVAIIRTQGVPVFQEGNVLNLANATLGVADACSGIRSLWVMLATAAAFGYFLRCGLVRSLILFVLAFPISVLFNIIRVVATGLMVAWFGPQFAQGTRHELTGSIVFFFGVVTLVAIGWLLARGRVQPSSPSAPVSQDGANEAAGSAHPGSAPRYVFVAVLGLLLVLGTAAQVIIKRHYVQTMPVTTRTAFSAFPAKIGDFVESGKGGFEMTQIDLLRPTDMLNKTYRSPNGTNLSLWSLYWEPYRGKKNAWSLGPHSPDGCYPASGWQTVKSGGPDVITGLIPGKNINVRVFTKESKKIVLVYFLSLEASDTVSTYGKSSVNRLKQMVTSWNSPDLSIGAQYVVTVQAPVTSSVQQTLQDVLLFVKQIAPVLPTFGV